MKYSNNFLSFWKKLSEMSVVEYINTLLILLHLKRLLKERFWSKKRIRVDGLQDPFNSPTFTSFRHFQQALVCFVDDFLLNQEFMD